jgi:hypothetical protein
MVNYGRVGKYIMRKSKRYMGHKQRAHCDNAKKKRTTMASYPVTTNCQRVRRSNFRQATLSCWIPLHGGGSINTSTLDWLPSLAASFASLPHRCHAREPSRRLDGSSTSAAVPFQMEACLVSCLLRLTSITMLNLSLLRH